MKQIMEFNMPEDKNEFTLASKGGDYWHCLWELDQQLRSLIKYGSCEEFGQSDGLSGEELAKRIRFFISESVDLEEVE